MPLEQTPLRPIQVEYRCDKCGNGCYRPTEVRNLMADPPTFQHVCTSCGDMQIFTERYPTLRYALEGCLLDLTNYQQQTL